MDKWVIHEPTAKTSKCDSDEPRTSANRHPTSENVPATTSAMSTTAESIIKCWKCYSWKI